MKRNIHIHTILCFLPTGATCCFWRFDDRDCARQPVRDAPLSGSHDDAVSVFAKLEFIFWHHVAVKF